MAADSRHGAATLATLCFLASLVCTSPAWAHEPDPHGPPVASAPSAAAASSPVMQASGPKTVPTGLVVMGRLGFAFQSRIEADHRLDALARRIDLVDGVAIAVPWDLLQPEAGKLDTSALDRALAQVSRYNEAAKRPLWVRLRIFASHRAPTWVKQLSGGAVQVRTPHHDEALQIARFWTEPYRRAWRQLQTDLAQRYDANPLVRGVSITSCTSRADEPFILPLDRDSIDALHKAGFSDAAYERCLREAPDDYAAWRKTPLDYTFNPFHRTDGPRKVDPAVSIDVMESFRRQLGGRAILMNHGLTYPLHDRAQPIYAALKRLGPPVALQMFAPDSSTWDAAIGIGIQEFAADSIEIWPAVSPKFGGYESLPDGRLSGWSERIRRAAQQRSVSAK